MILPRIKTTLTRLLIFAMFILFSLNVWLVNRLFIFASDKELPADVVLKDLPKNENATKQAQVLIPDFQPQPCASSIHIDKDQACVIGHRKPKKDFLTIGIPTVKRNNVTYLQKTLDSLIENSTPEERSEISVVIFAANFDQKLNQQTKTDLESKYREYFSNGFMQLIVAPRSFYPPLTNLKRNFGDSKDHVEWRAKQVVDYTFLFSYCHGHSEYYLQLEDDVISTPNFVKSIQGFIKINERKYWIYLEFSKLGFIDHLLRSNDLARLSNYMLLFYQEQPVDLLLYRYFDLNVQKVKYIHNPPIFKHIGVKSSLDLKSKPGFKRVVPITRTRKNKNS